MERFLINKSKEVQRNIRINKLLKRQILIRNLALKFEFANVFELYGLEAVFYVRSDDHFDVVVSAEQKLALQ